MLTYKPLSFYIHMDLIIPKPDADLAKRRVIAIMGKARSGKTTIAQAIARKMRARLLAFADPVYEVGEILSSQPFFSLQRDKGKDLTESGYPTTSAQFVQNVGEGMKYVFGSYVWVNVLHHRMCETDPRVPVVVSDLRFPQEHEYLKHYDLTTVLVYNEDREESHRNDYCEGETYCETAPYDVLYRVGIDKPKDIFTKLNL